MPAGTSRLSMASGKYNLSIADSLHEMTDSHALTGLQITKCEAYHSFRALFKYAPGYISQKSFSNMLWINITDISIFEIYYYEAVAFYPEYSRIRCVWERNIPVSVPFIILRY